MELRRIDAGSKKKDKSRSRSIRESAWMRDTEYHEWKVAIEKTSRIVDEGNYGASLFRSAWIGARIRLWGNEQGYEPADMIERLDHLLKSVQQSSVSERYKSSMTDGAIKWQKREMANIEAVKEFDEFMMDQLTDLGIEEFVRITKEKIQDGFDPYAWMERVRLLYRLPWGEEANILLSLYFQKHGSVPREQIIEWAKSINLIGEDSGKKESDLVHFASLKGFSGAAQHGQWGLPPSPSRLNSLPKIDIDTIDNVNLIRTLTLTDEIIVPNS